MQQPNTRRPPVPEPVIAGGLALLTAAVLIGLSRLTAPGPMAPAVEAPATVAAPAPSVPAPAPAAIEQPAAQPEAPAVPLYWAPGGEGAGAAPAELTLTLRERRTINGAAWSGVSHPWLADGQTLWARDDELHAVHPYMATLALPTAAPAPTSPPPPPAPPRPAQQWSPPAPTNTPADLAPIAPTAAPTERAGQPTGGGGGHLPAFPIPTIDPAATPIWPPQITMPGGQP